MKLAIIGSRDFTDYEKARSSFRSFFCCNLPEDIISGGARGADALAEKLSLEFLHKPAIVFEADWTKFGKSAGFKRNVQIIESSDIVLAFWDGISKGTRHSINLAKQMKKETIIIYV